MRVEIIHPTLHTRKKGSIIILERYVIDKDLTSDFSLDYLISILEFYFLTIYFGFETSRHQVQL